ncbi:unnamed protein product [Nippostrongylus brasiliensis]|uniref:Thyroid hormone receptor-associated protein complex subunit n=1 Tax=Nippostrongylus brasiliensis TaxID=27835 RepID=A0A0N4YU96_NIPBR|nr:unnamed protein product [Nippostrongylus brasiliensis]
MGARTAVATATWYPQHPQQGCGYLSAPVSQARSMANGPCPSSSMPSSSQHIYPSPYAPSLSPNTLKLSSSPSQYAQYALNYYHQHNAVREREREAFYRARGMMPPLVQQSDWRTYGKLLL